MSCDRADTVLHAYFDHELDALSAAEFERHIAECPECASALASLKSLRASMSQAQLYEKTPATLRTRVLADVHAVRPVVIPSATRRKTSWGWLAVAAAVLLLLAASWRLFPLLRGENRDALLAAEVVDAHLRSLQPGHLEDVISTDQHTVKPWFDGRIDFAPPVRDFAAQGFPLQGGRLDVVHGRTTAALVYGRRKHLVNVFIWPTGEPDAAPHSGSSQGYQWLAWRKSGMEFYAVSDTSGGDLAQLQQLFVQ
jgi:anti-sigma factor (TIGR02949 family)